MKYVSVILDDNIGKPLDYAVPTSLQDKVKKGVRVEVPIKKSFRKGYIFEVKKYSSIKNIKPIKNVISKKIISKELFYLASWISMYYVAPLNKVLRSIIPSSIRKDIKPSFKNFLSLKKSEGILVAEVTKGSPAEKGGLKSGDIILELNGDKITNINSFRHSIASLTPGKMVNFLILRDGKKKNIKIKLGVYPTSVAKKDTIKLGIGVSEISCLSPSFLNKFSIDQNSSGLAITSVKRNSIASRAGLRIGMVILELNQEKVGSIEKFQKIMKDHDNKKPLLLLVKYQNRTRFITIKVN